MKRIAALLLAMVMLLAALSACGSPAADSTLIPSDETESARPEEPTPEPSELPSEEPSAEPSEEPSEAPVESSEEPSQAPTAKPTGTPAPTPTPAPAPAPAPEPTPEPTPEPPASVDLSAFFDSIAAGDEEFNANMKLTGEYLDQLYPGMTAVAARQCLVYMPMMSGAVCEIALVEVEDSTGVSAVKAILQARIDAQADGGAWYPASCEAWETSSRIVSNGNYIMMIAYEKCDGIVSSFNALF